MKSRTIKPENMSDFEEHCYCDNYFNCSYKNKKNISSHCLLTLTIEPTDDCALKVLSEEGLSIGWKRDIDVIVLLSRVGGSSLAFSSCWYELMRAF
jgi:hypothetical protein